MSWPGWEESPAPAVVLPARPRQSRLRHGSEAYIQQHLSPQTVLVDGNGNMLPPVVDQFGRIQRSSSVSGPRPAIIINNDNGAQNAQYTDDRLPRRASSHRRHHSSTSGYYDNEIVRVRSGSRVRRMTPSPEIDEYDEDYYYDGRDRRKVIHYHHGRRPSSSSSHDGRRHYRSAEDEAALKKLDEMEREKKAEEQRKEYEKEMQMKKLKEEQEKLQREKENKELKEKAIEEYKIKQSEEEEKKKKRDEEEEEKMVRIFMAANPGTTERDARKFIRRGERNLERFGNGESEEFPSMRDMSSALTRSRPTHIKVHSRYLSPETLDVYNLPWAWDERDSGYIIIKQWVSEHEQEMLFNHTRKIKERARLTYPRERLKADSNQIVILKKDDDKKRKKSPNPIKRTSWFLT